MILIWENKDGMEDVKKFWLQIKYIVFVVVFALVLSGVGTLLVVNRVFSRGSKFTANYSGFVNSGEMFRFWFMSAFLFSLVGIAAVLFYKPKVDWICPSCEDIQAINNKQDVVLCKKCGQKMVPLKGYYDKDKTKEN